MADYYKEDSKHHILPPNISSYKYETSAPVIAQNINLNITNIIDEVKKQRMDIIKLNNELRNTRSGLDRKNTNDSWQRGEIIKAIKSLKREKEMLQNELKSYRDENSNRSSFKREKEREIEELKNENQDYKRRITQQNSEVQSLQYELYKIQMEFNDREKEDRMKESQKNLLETTERKVKDYKEKLKKETEDRLQIEQDLEEYKTEFDELVANNERLNDKLKQVTMENNSIKNSTNNDDDYEDLKEELVMDCNVLNKLSDNLALVIEHMENISI